MKMERKQKSMIEKLQKEFPDLINTNMLCEHTHSEILKKHDVKFTTKIIKEGGVNDFTQITEYEYVSPSQKKTVYAYERTGQTAIDSWGADILVFSKRQTDIDMIEQVYERREELFFQYLANEDEGEDQ